MLNLIVATQAEADPVIARFNLKKTSSAFNCYEGRDLRLVISGIGKCNAAIACGWLANKTPDSKSAPVAWLNLGIAGHLSAEQGTAFMAHKITDITTEKVWFPHRLSNDLPSSDLITVEKPLTSYIPDRLHDMEASAFTEAARKFSDAELVQILKVVSDNEMQPWSKVTPKLATTLIANNIEPVALCINNLKRICDTITAPYHQISAEILNHWHFSVSQKVQLERLLQRHKVFLGCMTEIPPELQELKSSKEALTWLKNRVDSASLTL